MYILYIIYFYLIRLNINKLIFYFISRFILNVPKLQRNLLELKKFFLNQLNMLFPKINVYYQQMPQTIKCQLAITEYGSSKYLLYILYFNCSKIKL